MSMALVMSQMPDVWRKVLAEHVPDQGGRCRECRDAAGQTASWPCQTYRVAQEAKWVAEGNLPGTGPHGPGPSASPRVSPPSTPPRSWDLDAPTGYGAGRGDYANEYSANEYSSGAHRGGDPLSPSWRPSGEPTWDGGDPATYGSAVDAPYGASFGVDDRRPQSWY